MIREKIYHLATIIQNLKAVGLFVTDIPSGSRRMSRFNVEETVVDGVLLLTFEKIAQERKRYLEVYKMRNTAHLDGSHQMLIQQGGISLK